MDLPKLAVGDIVFVMHHDNWISRAIAWFMRSQWSHSCVVVDPSSTDRTYVSETSDYEITLGWVERYSTDDHTSMSILRLPDLSEHEKVVTVFRALSQEESVYPYWQLVSLAIRGLFKRVGIRIGNLMPWGYNCSEHVMYALNETHYPQLKGVDPHSMDTEDFYQLVKAIPGVAEIYTK